MSAERVEYDESWRKKIKYGGPPIDWDVAWEYFEAARERDRRRERYLNDPGFRLLCRVRQPGWGSKAREATGASL